MDVAKFERIARNSGFTPLTPEHLPDATVLIAERFLTEAEEAGRRVPFPHWEMLWAIARDGVREGRTIRIPAYESSRKGIVFPVPIASRADDRRKEVIADAREWIECGKYAGLY